MSILIEIPELNGTSTPRATEEKTESPTKPVPEPTQSIVEESAKAALTEQKKETEVKVTPAEETSGHKSKRDASPTRKKDRGSKIVVTDESGEVAAVASPDEKPMKKDKTKRLTKESITSKDKKRMSSSSGKRKSTRVSISVPFYIPLQSN